MNFVYVLSREENSQPIAAVTLGIVTRGALTPPGWRSTGMLDGGNVMPGVAYHLGVQVERWRLGALPLNEARVRQMVEDAAADSGTRVIASFIMDKPNLHSMGERAFTKRLQQAMREGFQASDGAHLG